MSRIDQCFQSLKSSARKALIPYIAVGDPHLNWTLPLMHQLVANGADIIELGVPFSDPMVDGPVIQQAHERALTHKVNLQDCLQVVAEFRKTNHHTPVLLMGYLNPIEMMGYGQFAVAGKKAGVDAALIVDVPLEEADSIKPVLSASDIALIDLLAPTTKEERRRTIAEQNNSFLYYVSFQGITGAASLNTQQVSQQVAHIKQLTDRPLVVGFGISDEDSAVRASKGADGVVVGSALVTSIISHVDSHHLAEVDSEQIRAGCQLIADIRQALDTHAID